MVHSMAFKIPVMGDLAQMLRAKSVSEAGVRAQLTTGGNDGTGAGHLVSITIGGGREAAYARPNSMDVVVNCRKGFVKQAIQTGAYIIPSITFGENELMDVVNEESGITAWAMKQISTLLWKTKNQREITLRQGRFGIPFFCPHRRPVNIVFGYPIPVEQRDESSQKYIKKIHKRYVEDLEQLFRDWRETFGIDRSVKFRIVE